MMICEIVYLNRTIRRKTVKENKWIINVESKDFTERVWQCEHDFTSEQLNEVIGEWANKVQDILVGLSDGKSTEEILEKIDNDYYPLGDLVNFLENIQVNVMKVDSRYIAGSLEYTSDSRCDSFHEQRNSQ